MVAIVVRNRNIGGSNSTNGTHRTRSGSRSCRCYSSTATTTTSSRYSTGPCPSKGHQAVRGHLESPSTPLTLRPQASEITGRLQTSILKASDPSKLRTSDISCFVPPSGSPPGTQRARFRSRYPGLLPASACSSLMNARCVLSNLLSVLQTDW